MLIITVIAGHPAIICVTRRNSRKIRWASMLIRKRWLPLARREHRRGTCTSVPGRANLLPRNPTILGSFSKEMTRRRIACDARTPNKRAGALELQGTLSGGFGLRDFDFRVSEDSSNQEGGQKS